MDRKRNCVTAPSPSDVFKQYSHALQLAAPREWDAFVQCFDAYSADVTVAVIHADQTEILNKQGQAKAFVHLLHLFRTCHIPRPTPTPAQGS